MNSWTAIARSRMSGWSHDSCVPRPRRTETALLRLWFAGFHVEPELVRAAWLQGLGRHSIWIKRSSERRIDPEAVFSNLAFAATKNPTVPFGIDRHSATDAIAEILHAYFGDTYKLEIEAVFEPVAAMLAGSDAW